QLPARSVAVVVPVRGEEAGVLLQALDLHLLRPRGVVEHDDGLSSAGPLELAREQAIVRRAAHQAVGHPLGPNEVVEHSRDVTDRRRTEGSKGPASWTDHSPYPELASLGRLVENPFREADAAALRRQRVEPRMHERGLNRL